MELFHKVVYIIAIIMGLASVLIAGYKHSAGNPTWAERLIVYSVIASATYVIIGWKLQ